MSFSRKLLLAAAAALVPFLHAADEKKEEKKETPKIIMAVPFAVTAGTNKLVIRGLLLTNATAVRLLSTTNLAFELKSRGKAAVPDKGDPKKLGDTQVEVQLVLPEDFPSGDLPFRVNTPEGDTNTNLLHVVTGNELFDEKEPNASFRKPNDIALPQTIRGVIQDANDVDVFRFKGKAGQKISVRTRSARYGSTLDPILSVFDSQGHTLKTSDDSEDLDARLALTLARDGDYFLAVNDAHDRGGASFTYLIQLIVEP
jgi:hypothetical protein